MATRRCGYEGITGPSTIPEIFIIERMKQEKLRKKCDNKNQKAGKNTVVARKVPKPWDTGSFQKLEKEKKYTFHRTPGKNAWLYSSETHFTPLASRAMR